MTKTAKVYGDSLYELAVETQKSGRDGYVEELFGQLEDVKMLFSENPDYLRLLQAPALQKKTRIDLIDEAFANSMEEYLVNFLKLLCDQNVLGELLACIEEYRQRYMKDNNIAQVQVISASELEENRKAELIKKLEKVFGKKIVLVTKTDPDLIGGMVINAEGRQFDGSVRGRLGKIHRRISGR